MGFDRYHTFQAMPAKERKSDPAGFEVARCALIGNTFHAGVVAWQLSSLLLKWGFLKRMQTVSEIANPALQCNLTTASHDAEIQSQSWKDNLEGDAEMMLVRYYMTRQSHRGGDISFLGSHAASRMTLPRSVNPEEWQWVTSVSTAWQFSGEHINVLEARALLLAVRWRFRRFNAIGCRFLHLIDSRVTMGIAIKGRSSSRRLRKVLSKINANLVAAHATMVSGFVRSELSPADGPSRKRKAESAFPADPGKFSAAKGQCGGN